MMDNQIDIFREVKKFGSNKDKTGWYYLEIGRLEAELLSISRKSFRVKGFLDEAEVQQLSLLPAGEGSFILPLNADIRRKLKKDIGQLVRLQLKPDHSLLLIDPDLLDTLDLFPEALGYFEVLKSGHKNYFSKYVASAKTIETKNKRIDRCIFAFQNRMSYSEMQHYFKAGEG